MVDQRIIGAILLFLAIDFSVLFAFFRADWITSHLGGEVQIGLWQTCITAAASPQKNSRLCFVTLFSTTSSSSSSTTPIKWICAIIFILFGCVATTLTAIVLIISLKSSREMLDYARWLGLAALTAFCLAAICIPMGFSMPAIKGEPFQLPSSCSVGWAYIIFNIAIWATALSELILAKIHVPNF